jgi:hypothetical protein
MLKLISRVLIIMLIINVPIFLYAINGDEGKHKYVGAKLCGMCHKTDAVGKQYTIWENSKHAQAYNTLKTEDADRIAKAKGYSTKAIETPECLKCHATGYNIDASLLTDKFNISDGVQCETCHGPGSDYKSIKIMKDKKLAVDNGLIIYDKPEQLCLKCHNEESPYFKGFNFNEMWPKIAHSIPKK